MGHDGTGLAFHSSASDGQSTEWGAVIITAIELQNFKGIRERVRIPIRPITLLFGPNSAGKSTVIQAFHYAKEVLERGNVDADRTVSGGETVDLGGFLNLVHRHDSERCIGLGIEVDLQAAGLPVYEDLYSDEADAYTGRERRDCLERKWGELGSAPPEARLGSARSAGIEVLVGCDGGSQCPAVLSYGTSLNARRMTAVTRGEGETGAVLSHFNFFHPALSRGDISDLEQSDCFNEALAKVCPLVYMGRSLSAPLRGHLPDVALAAKMKSWRSPLPAPSQNLGTISGIWADELWSDPKGEANIAEFSDFLRRVLVGPADLVRQYLGEFRYLGPIREIPPRGYRPLRSRDDSRWPGGLAAWDELYRGDRSFVREVNDWMGLDPAAGKKYRLSVEEFRRVGVEDELTAEILTGDGTMDRKRLQELLRSIPVGRELALVDTAAGVDMAPADVGVGVSQMIPVLAMALSPTVKFSAIEQPELHLHPAMQVKLGDLFVTEAVTNKKTFLIETHSEHLLLRIMRRMRETAAETLPQGIPPVRPEDVAVLYVEQGPTGSVVREMPLNERGELVKAWPGGFFEEDLEEIF